MSKRIVLTGGGTAGHVTPNIALISTLQQHDWDCFYIGSKNGIEHQLISKISVPYFNIASGKLRRYFSLQNFIDPFKVIFGVIQSFIHLSKIKPDIIFSKGGFVSLPVVIAAWLKRIPVVAHESDLTPGLTTKLTEPFARKICITFEKGKQFFKHKNKVVVTGTPIRSALFNGDKQQGQLICQFKEAKPTLLIMGGGLGSVAINQIVRQVLNELLTKFNIIHLCGKGKVDPSISKKGYCQFEYVEEELPDLYALADLVISRSGANSVYEVLSLKKPHIFIPLSLGASRGDQIHNAEHFKQKQISEVLNEKTLTGSELIETIENIFSSSQKRQQKIESLNLGNGTDKVISVLENELGSVAIL